MQMLEHVAPVALLKLYRHHLCVIACDVVAKILALNAVQTVHVKKCVNGVMLLSSECLVKVVSYYWWCINLSIIYYMIETYKNRITVVNCMYSL